MKPTIVVLDRLHRTTELNTLRQLLSKILHEYDDGKASIFPNDVVKDFICLVDTPELRIGLLESDSLQKAYSLQLDFFANKSCDLLFCNCLNNEKLIQYLQSLHTGNRIDLIQLKSIWLHSIPIKALEENEVDKLFEIIEIKRSSKFEIPLKKIELSRTIAG